MLIKSITIPINCISNPLKGNIAKEIVVPIAGIKKLMIPKEQTGQPAENKLNIKAKIPVPDSLL